MTNYYTLFSVEIKVTPEEKEWLLAYHAKGWSDSDAEPDEYEFDMEYKEEDKAVWIYAEESGNVDQVAEMMVEFLAKFHPDQYFTMEWASTAGRPVLDGFGGGAVFVTASGYEYVNTGAWASERENQWRRCQELNIPDPWPLKLHFTDKELPTKLGDYLCWASHQLSPGTIYVWRVYAWIGLVFSHGLPVDVIAWAKLPR